MRLTPKELARALYAATKDASDKEAVARVARFAATLAAQGLGSLLPAVIEALPAAANAADGIEEVTVESAHDMSERAAEELLRLAGIDPRKAAVNRRTVPDLVAGARIRRKDTIIDTSARRLLVRIREGARSSGNE